MAIDRLNGRLVCHTDMLRLDTHKLAVFLVSVVDGDKAAAAAGLEEQPEIGEGCREGRRDATQMRFGQVR